MPTPQPSAPPGDTEYLFPDSSGTPLGAFQQAAGSRTQFTLDYTIWLDGDVLTGANYTCAPGTFPALAVTGSKVSNGAQLSFLVSGGLVDTTYNISVTARTKSGASKVDAFVMQVLPAQIGPWGGPRPPWEGRGGWDGRGPWEDRGPYPPSVGDLSFANVAVATDGNGDLIVINPRPKYTVSTIAPQNANLFDKWYNPADGCVYDWTTDGGSSFWLSSVVDPRVPVFTAAPAAPTASAQPGDMWFNTATNALSVYVFNGTTYSWLIV